MEASIKFALVNQFTPLQCPALTSVGYELKYANNAFTFKETVAEMWQCYDKERSETEKKKPPQPVLSAEEERHKQALAAATTPMFTSKSSDIQVVMSEGAVSVNPVKYRAYLGVGPKPDPGSSATPKEVQGE